MAVNKIKRVLLPPLGPRGETHTLVWNGVGGPNSDEVTDILVLFVYYNSSTVQEIGTWNMYIG